MWQLKTIKAQHICSFESLDYTLKQDTATLVFGNNMDSDSQNSNGAGKSALIEAIAVLLTGEPLRKVNIDELINDNFDDLLISGELYNTDFHLTLSIDRGFTRKTPQSIAIKLNNEPVIQSSVIDYNKYILEQLGITKEDVYSNFILTARKYKSFLTSSDKDKKDIINRFSNGTIVDESIEILQNDILPLTEQFNEAQKKVAECAGKVAAMCETIERTINESADRQTKRQESIESHKQSIANKRAEIRSIKEQIDTCDNKLEQLYQVDTKMQELEQQNLNINQAYKSIASEFNKVGIVGFHNYDSDFQTYSIRLEDYERKLTANGDSLKKYREAVEKANHSFQTIAHNYDERIDEFDTANTKIQKEIQELLDKAKMLSSQERDLDTKRRSIESNITRIKAELSGVITCPKCNHKFLLNSNTDYNELTQQCKQLNISITELNEAIIKSQQEYDRCKELGQSKRAEETAIQTQKDELVRSYNEAKSALDICRNRMNNVSQEMESIQESVKSIQNRRQVIAKDMFDDVFKHLDTAIENEESKIKQHELRIATVEGVISSLEQAIQELEHSNNEKSLLISLTESKNKNEAELTTAIQAKEKIEQELNVLKVQENTFLEFKSHLANTKITAINQIINEFLVTIGSDIRISLSGYSVTKTGKLRDKISVSLMRDGVDCGSFDKFSKGEQTRVELASILALHRLVNANADEFKGLNLLIIDEILDATDEQGLSNVFKALNDTHITSLVVSHGYIAESYPNKLIINKQNGVSFI